MKLLAGFFLDPLGIGLQLVYLLGIFVIFFLKPANILLQALVLGPFRPVNRHTVRAQHSVHKEPDGNNYHRAGCYPPANCIELFKNRFSPDSRFFGPSLCLIRALREGAQSFLWRRDDADFGETYSKIHCLAAALSFCNSCALGASE